MNEMFGELRAAAVSVWHRRWLVLGVAWGVCLLGWMAVAMIPNKYESKARIFVELDDVLSDQLKIANGGKDEIDRVRKTLAGGVNLEKVVRGTDLGADVATPREMEQTVANLAENVKVESQEDSLFTITALIGKPSLSDAQNAKLAQDVVQKLIDIFREENIAGNRGEVADTVVFLDQQLEQRKAELEAAEAKLSAFEAAHPDLVGGSSAISSRLAATRQEVRGVDADLAAAQSALAAINGQLAGTPRTLAAPGGSDGSALGQTQAQLAAMQARGLTDSHPDVVALKRQITLLQRAGGGQASGMPNPAYSSLISIKAEREANVQALMARMAALQADVSGAMADQASEPSASAEANRISRDYDVLKKKYDELLQNREEMRLRGQVEDERSSFKFDVVDPPSTPRNPASPNRPLLLLGVLILGLGAGVGSALALGQLRSTFATTAGLERALDLPVIGAISENLTGDARALRAKRMKLFYAATGSLGGVFLMLLTIEFVQRGMVA
ncbi:XrtA system polysaccharide chain length determinant [Parafrankia sp. BMG5.11]|uniref:XrtA system polysaccharide chain length determinant n=1 Tax=Parafrankia sp. BMG5.11 TaxID=222540 RepID=UPI00103C0656|nr:XrtA system polysaccharide chain length determinant [Parafrankia sp. BMG5.11]TCJ37440.1 chain-length determining protein [Parafrankia sp. BMG5.11]